MIRKADKGDITWLLALASDCYKDFDRDSSELWLQEHINDSSFIILRGDDSAVVASLSATFWQPKDIVCQVEFMASRKTRKGKIQLLHMLHKVNDLRKSVGCAKFYLDSIGADISAYAKRLGARQTGNFYMVN